MTTTPNHAVMAAYSPRIAGPSARARIIPPTPAATVAQTLNAAVPVTVLATPGRRNVVAKTCSLPGAACTLTGSDTICAGSLSPGCQPVLGDDIVPTGHNYASAQWLYNNISETAA